MPYFGNVSGGHLIILIPPSAGLTDLLNIGTSEGVREEGSYTY